MGPLKNFTYKSNSVRSSEVAMALQGWGDRVELKMALALTLSPNFTQLPSIPAF